MHHLRQDMSGGKAHNDSIDSVKLLKDHENDGDDQLRPVLPLAEICCTQSRYQRLN